MASRDTIKRRAFKRKQEKAREKRGQKANTGQVTSVALPSSRTYDGFSGLSPSDAVRGKSSPQTRGTLEARVQTDPRATGSTSAKVSSSSTSYVTNDPHYGSWGGWTHPDFVREDLVRKKNFARAIYQCLDQMVRIVKPFFEQGKREYDLGIYTGIDQNSALANCYAALQRAYQTTNKVYRKLSNPEARRQYLRIRWIKNMRAEKARQELLDVSQQLNVDALKKYHGRVSEFLRSYAASEILTSLRDESRGWCSDYLKPYHELLDIVGRYYREAFQGVIPNTIK